VLNRIALILAAAEIAMALLLGGSLIFSGSDPATAGLDQLAGIVLLLVVAVFAVPAARLAWQGGRTQLALGLTIAPLLLLGCAFVALILSMA